MKCNFIRYSTNRSASIVGFATTVAGSVAFTMKERDLNVWINLCNKKRM